jgi:hypothetical protein
MEKVIITISEDLLQQAAECAQRLGITREEFFVETLKQWIEKH